MAKLRDVAAFFIALGALGGFHKEPGNILRRDAPFLAGPQVQTAQAVADGFIQGFPGNGR